MPRDNRQRRNVKFPEMLAHGESPHDFNAQTVNGTARAGNSASGWNKQWNWGAEEQVPAEGPWAGNRSGE